MSGVHYLTGLIWLLFIYYVLKLPVYYLYLDRIAPNIVVRPLITRLRDCARPYAENALHHVERFFYGTPLKLKSQRENEIYRTAVILSRVLDQDVVINLLDTAEFWADIPLASRFDRKRFGVCIPIAVRRLNSPGAVYLEATIPSNIPPNVVRAITFSITSTDNGRKEDVDAAGSIDRGTWFDALIISPDPENTYETEQLIISTHEIDKLKTHTVTWSVNHENQSIRDLIRKMRGGWKIKIRVWADGFYVNFVQNARIDMQVKTVRKM